MSHLEGESGLTPAREAYPTCYRACLAACLAEAASGTERLHLHKYATCFKNVVFKNVSLRFSEIE